MLATQPDKLFDIEKGRLDRFTSSPVDRVIVRRREIQYLAGGGTNGGGVTPGRTVIKTFSPASGNRLRRYIDNYYTDFTGMVTLTYGPQFPTDGRIVKKHLNALFERMRRFGWFDAESLVWWLEFQERGAPHIHMLVTGWISKHMISRMWSQTSGAPITTSTRIEQLRNPDAAGSYAAKYACKSDQKTVPTGFEGVGRFWGRRGARPAAGPVIPRLMAAATPGLPRGRLRAYARARAGGYTKIVLPYMTLNHTRVYEHDGGWSIYGPEREIAELWWYLDDLNRQQSSDRRKGVKND